MGSGILVRRPTVRTSETREAILGYLRMGLARYSSAAKAGISRQTLHSWMAEDPEFLDSVCKAEDEAQANFEMVLTKAAASGNVSVALEFLRRRRHKDWGDKSSITADVTGSVSLAEALKKTEEMSVDELQRLHRETLGTSG